MDQKDIFISSEGDAWYKRNSSCISSFDASADPIIKILSDMNIKPSSIAEVGCSSGYRLAELKRLLQCRCMGIEPSSEAIDIGTTLYQDIEIQIGTADKLPWSDDSIDLLIYGFCLYLCDRKDLFIIAAEADRVLKENGTIVIYDFSPGVPIKNQYSHYEGTFSYKMDYSQLFLWNPSYYLLSSQTMTHSINANLSDRNERVGVSVLMKSSESAYLNNI